jgi:two-component system osmolarity sensor histidine kinase EnvZ
MEHMVQEYIDYIRGEGSEEPTEMDIASYMELLVDSCRRSGQAVELAVQSSAVLSLKRRAFRRAVDNIIGNALRYGTRCRVSISATEKYASIAVEDEGPGIPEHLFVEVFKPFARLDSSRNARTGGVGLGLTIARDIVQAHGGDITLKNRTDERGERCGLTVTLRLPLLKAA